MMARASSTSSSSALASASVSPSTTRQLDEYALSGMAFKTGTLPDLRYSIEQWLENAEQSGRNRLVGFINPHVFNFACTNTEVRNFLRQADIVCIDGIGISLALLCRQGKITPRVVAEHLFNQLLDAEAKPASTPGTAQSVLIGVTPEAVRRAAHNINERSDTIHVRASIDGFRSEHEYRQFLSEHRDAKMILIGAASPASEKIALMANSICTGSIIFHIGGGTINTLAGNKKPVPRIISRCGLQWLHRVITEPHTRSRYLFGGWQFFKHMISGQNVYPEH